MLPPIHQSKPTPAKPQGSAKTQPPSNPYAKSTPAPTPTIEPIDVIDLAPTEPVQVSRAPIHRSLVEPPPPPKPRRFIDKVATFLVQAVCVIILVAIVIFVAAYGVPLGGGWVLHSVWLAILIGFAIAFPLEYLLRRGLGLVGISILPLLTKKKA